MTLRLHGTEYNVRGGAQYHSQIWASTRAHALEIMRVRGLGERPCAWTDRAGTRASWLMRQLLDRRSRDKPPIGQVMHALVHLGHMVIAAQREAAIDVLGDDGWLHEAAHRIAWVDDPPPFGPYVARVIEAERSVPGYLHPTRPHPRWNGVRT